MNPGLYLHVPFCLTKCLYCDFYSTIDQNRIPLWLQALESEIRLYSGEAGLVSLDEAYGGRGFQPVQWLRQDACAIQLKELDTLYLGGGTPSLLAAPHLTDIFSLLRRNFRLTPDAEITLEANPDDVTPEKLRLWQELGINRLSLGVQSLDDTELRFLGRRHSAAQAHRAVALAREAGFDNLGVDLIYALPEQTAGCWLATLAGVLAWQPEHLSCYQLTLEEHTPLGQKLARGEISEADEERQRAFFLLTSEYLAGRGYLHYEVSNFARGERFIARHNSKYWRQASYLGLGPAAHSFDGRRRWWNVRSVEEYCRLLGEGRAPIAGKELLTATQRDLEALCLGLRTRWGVALDTLSHFPQAAQTLAGLCQSGLLTIEKDRARPTREGFLVADSLALMLSE